MREKKRFFSLEGKDDQQRLMITRLGNIQVGKGQYLYKTGRCIWGTKSKDLINGSGKSERAHRLVKGEQRDKDNKRVMKRRSWKQGKIKR